MPMYTPKEIQERMSENSSQKVKSREMEIQPNTKYKIWIPKAEFCGIKRHYRIRTVPSCKYCKINAINCINQEDESKHCPICKYTEKLWGQWNATKSKPEKQKILQTINGLTSVSYYVNVIDLADEEQQFKELQLTNGVMKELNSILLDIDDIANYVFTFKKTVRDNHTKYTIIETENPKITDKLKEKLDELWNRPFEEGGPNPLEEIHTYDKNEAKYLKFLTGKSNVDGDTNDDITEELVVEESEIDDISDDIGEDNSISSDDADIDNLDIDDSDLSSEEKPEITESSLDEDLSDDDLELDDDLEMDLEIEDKPVMVTIDSTFIKDNQKDKLQMKRVMVQLKDKVKLTKSYKENIKLIYNYLKTNSFEMKQDDLIAPEF